MRNKLSLDGLCVLFVVTTGVLRATDAAHGHGHHNSDVLGRIMHKSAASSGSNMNTPPMHAVASLTSMVEPPTESLLAAGCFDTDCASPNSTQLTEVSARVTPMSQAQLQVLELPQDAPSNTPTRRRQHSRSVITAHEVETPKTVEVKSPSSNTPSKPISIPPVSTALVHENMRLEAQDVLDDTATAKEILSAFELPSSHFTPYALVPRQAGSYQSFVLGPFPRPTSTSVAPASTATSVCPAGNGTTYNSAANIDYQVVCDIDFLDNDYPFQLVGSFEECVQKCDAYNYNNHGVECLAALFAPSREGDANDCYLKYSVAHPTTAALPIQGAIRLTGVKVASSSSPVTAASTSSDTSTSTSAIDGSSSTSSSTVETSTSSSSAIPSASATSVSSPGVTYASGNSVIVPKVAGSHLQGPSQNIPSKQYVEASPAAGITLASSLLTVGVNGDLTTGYGLSAQTGVLEVNISTQSYLGALTQTPHISRDGGRGGFVNGQHLFFFCDTGSYTTTSSSANGQFLGFVSSSVAIDTGMNGLGGGALHLQDGIGEWSDNTGRMRGFAPLTEGEQAYNQAMQGFGQRYAIWPESSIIPVDATTGVIYAPIVYDNVNTATRAAVFTYTGATLLTVTAGGKGGPVAERTVAKIFDQNEVEWGCAGGIRSWGASGIGGNDGSVYIFGNINGGILLGRTSPATVGDRNSFEYWDGTSWTNTIQTSSSKAFFIEGAFMDVDVFYSPRHLTFIIVYMTIYADSAFYYRYLEADQGILPPFAPGGKSSDYVENILKYSWSTEQVLYKAATGLSGKYIYSGGVHEGYFGSNDIINGGTKMLLSWTAPTGQDPSSFNSEYQIVTAEIDWA